MESKSHDSDELVAALLNSVETLSKKFDKLDDQVKKNTDSSEKVNESLLELNKTVLATNTVFDQVATGVKDLYEKVKTLEIITKVMGNLGNLGPLLGGLGGQKKP
jgi:prophage DNA circulation protein